MDNLTWMPLKGEVSINQKNVEFKSIGYSDAKIRCNQMFRGGTISFKVRFHSNNVSEKPMRVFVGLNENTNFLKMNFGISSNSDFSITQDTSMGSNILASTELENNIVKQNEPIDYRIKIEVIGAQATIYANDVLVCRTERAKVSFSQITLVLEGEGKISIHNFEVVTNKLKAFIIMDFSEEFEYIYTEVINPVCKSLDIECYRADEYNYPGSIIKDVLDSIRDSDIIIADITPDNPNVYLEVGYAYALEKNPILLMNKDREKLPFDVSGFRVIMYNNTIKGAPHVREKLTKFLKAVMSN